MRCLADLPPCLSGLVTGDSINRLDRSLPTFFPAGTPRVEGCVEAWTWTVEVETASVARIVLPEQAGRPTEVAYLVLVKTTSNKYLRLTHRPMSNDCFFSYKVERELQASIRKTYGIRHYRSSSSKRPSTGSLRLSGFASPILTPCT